MSERSGGGVGPFLLGAAIGAALGYLFAPAPGTETRRKLSRRLQDLKELASTRHERAFVLPNPLLGWRDGVRLEANRSRSSKFWYLQQIL